MYGWIDGEKWAGDGQPGLTEYHGMLAADCYDPPRVYGRLFSDEETRVVSQTLVNLRFYGVPEELPL